MNIDKSKIKKSAAIVLLVAALAGGKGCVASEAPEEHLDKWCPMNKVFGIEHQVKKINAIPGYKAMYLADGTIDQSLLENGKYYVIHTDGTKEEFSIDFINENDNLSNHGSVGFAKNEEIILVKAREKFGRRQETKRQLQNGNTETTTTVYDSVGNVMSELKQLHNASGTLFEEFETIYGVRGKKETTTYYYENGVTSRKVIMSYLQNDTIETAIKNYSEDGSLVSEQRQLHTTDDILLEDVETYYNADGLKETTACFYEDMRIRRVETTRELQNGNIETVIKSYDEEYNLVDELKQVYDQNGNLVEDNETVHDGSKTK